MTQARMTQALTQDESMRLLASVRIGRVVFTQHALPAVRPVSHLVAGDKIIIIMPALDIAISRPADGGAARDRTVARDGAVARDATVVAYQADLIDPGTCLGWSVVVVGTASLVRDQAEIAGYRQALPPWVAGEAGDVIAIEAELVTGFQLVGSAAPDLASGTVG